MARFKNDNVYFEPNQKLSFRDDDGSEAASIYWDGDQMVFDGITISGAEGPPGPAGTGIPGNYIGDEDGNSRVTVNTTDEIVFKTAGSEHMVLSDSGNLLLGDDDASTAGGKLNIAHTGNNGLVMDRFSNTSDGGGIWFKKARGVRTEVGALSAANNDTIGDVKFFAYGETAGGLETFLQAAGIKAVVDGVPGEDSMPGRLEFWTTDSDWTSAELGLTITQNAGIKLNSGYEVNDIVNSIDGGSLDTELVTAKGMYDAFTEFTTEVDEQLATLSGIDLRMNRIFDTTYSGTEVKVDDDKIKFFNQGDEVASFDELGYFNFGGHKINTIFTGNLATEASTYAVPTCAAVKSYVDEYSGSGGAGWAYKISSESGLTKLQLSDVSWEGTLSNKPLLSAYEFTLVGGSMAGKKVRSIRFGDEIDDLPTFDNSNMPALALHSLHGSRLYIYNKKNYGDDTLPYMQTPGITINRAETSVGDSRGSISFGAGSIEVFTGNQETYPDLPDSEHEMHIKLGTYDVYDGEVSSGGPFYGGLLKLFCKLRFMNGYSWGYENDSNWINPIQDTDGWGHYGNNVWVNRIAGCHYTKTEDEVGAKFNKPASEFIGTGNDDHCLVTGKYVHEAINIATELWESKTENSRISSGTEGYDWINHSVITGPTGVQLTYGWDSEFASQLLLQTPSYANHSTADKYKVGARFISSQASAHNRVLIESQCQGASDPVEDQIHDYYQTAGKLVFFRSRKGWFGDVAEYGAQPLIVGDNIGQISWIGQALNSGYNRNPCQHYSGYQNSAAIRVLAADNAGTYRIAANMDFHVDNGYEQGYYTDIIKLMSLRGRSQTIHLGDFRNTQGYTRYETGVGQKAVPGKVHIHDASWAKSNLSGNLTLTSSSSGWGSMNASIMFAGATKNVDGAQGLEVAKNTGNYYNSVGGYYNAPWARMDGGPDGDWNIAANNGGRLSFMIHRHQSLKFDEIIRIDGSGRVIVGEDDNGQTCGATTLAKMTIAQNVNDYRGGLSLVNVGGDKAFLFVNDDDELELDAASDGTGTIVLNGGNGPVHFGNTSSNSEDYVARFNGNVIPAINNSYDLGSSTYKWDNIWATNNVIQTSDRNQKTEIRKADFGLDFVKSMKPVSFRRKGGKRRHYGFIAQDLEALVRKFGRDTKDAAFVVKDPDGNYGLRDTQLIAILAKAIQELAAKVEG